MNLYNFLVLVSLVWIYVYAAPITDVQSTTLIHTNLNSTLENNQSTLPTMFTTTQIANKTITPLIEVPLIGLTETKIART